tara:strand:+ start:433 stop:867 length:435 start_codon:yes stop_codon:yes gene_type:complete
MSSKRKNIINDVIEKLKTIKTPRLGKVSEKPTEFARLARTAYPFVQVNVIDEIKEDIATEWRLATLTVGITVHIEGKSKTEKSEEQLADIIEAIEEKLEVDRTRDSNAQTTEVLEVEDIQITGYPTVSQTIRVGIQYTYSRGNT